MRCAISVSALGATLWILLATAPASARGDQPAPLVELQDRSANVSLSLPTDERGTIALTIESRESPGKVHLMLSRAGAKAHLEPASLLPSVAWASLRSYPGPETLTPTNRVGILLKFRSHAWAVYAEDRLMLLMPAPFAPPLAVLPAGRLGSMPRDSAALSIQKVAPFNFIEHFLVPEGETTPSSDWTILSGWEAVSGQWRLHTAADSTAEEARAQRPDRKAATPDRSPNFYSLLGSGTNAIMVAGYSFYDDYTMEAAVRTGAGEGGLLALFTEEGSALGFTVTMESEHAMEGLFRLWSVVTNAWSTRTILGAVRAPLTSGQWFKLALRVGNDRVACWVDRTPVIERAMPLAPGGRFGLYVNATAGIRFDDVWARSETALDLRSAEAAFHVRAEEGSFFLSPAPSRRRSGSSDLVLQPSRDSRPRFLIFGPFDQKPHVFAATFDGVESEAPIGLIVGYTGSAHPYYRWVRHMDAKSEIFRLERVKPALVTVLEEVRLPQSSSAGSGSASVRLMSDATENLLRLYRNEELVLMHRPSGPVLGASGLYLGGGQKPRIRDLSHRMQRDDLYRNQFEKNRLFVDDPFMRHWSSPEGQWYEDPRRGGVWYKGDCYGRVGLYMPWVPGSEIHLGVEEETTNGTLVLTASSDALALGWRDTPRASPRMLDHVPVGDLLLLPTNHPEHEASARWYTLTAEGYWTWIESAGRLILKTPLPRPLRGRRVRIAGFSTEQLKYSRIDLYQVKDYLFTESLHEWIVNGGRWEVVSRFQCQPQWSHMTGESADTLAALWTKYEFEGDFCVELYAGIRHGWYQRCGDLNLTVLNRSTTPSEGYTVTCTGWDPDHSQLYTTLYREGVPIARSDRYTVPRYREGNRRLTGDPLIRQGRDVHGAWYYIRFRRVGQRLEYDFDNERCLTVEDTDPPRAGGLGIWTFLNSMVVARVKIAAEKIRPRLMAFTPVELTAGRNDDRLSPPEPAVALHGTPVPVLSPRYWQVEDPVGHMQLEWHRDDEGGWYFATRNLMGSGSMAARCEWPAVPWSELAGWTFEVRRTPRAVFNFYYSLGRLDPNGAYVPHQRFFHRLTGTDFSRGKFRMTGTTDVPATLSTGSGWHTSGPWTRVTVWIPGDGAGLPPLDSNVLVRIEGFGLLQTCIELQGVTGNGPGEGYAVRNLREIRYAPPLLSTLGNQAGLHSFTLRNPASGKVIAESGSLKDISEALQGLRGDGLLQADLLVQSGGHTARIPLAWIRLPEHPPLHASWSETIDDTLILESRVDYPDPRFLRAEAWLGGRPLREERIPEPAWAARRTFPFPRLPEFSRRQASDRPIELRYGASTLSVPLPSAPAADRWGPVLLAIEGPFPILETFERRALRPPVQPDPARMQLGYGDPEQSTYLVVRNRGHPERLRALFTTPFDLSERPVLRFRYRAEGLVRVSLGFDQPWRVALNEPLEGAVRVRGGPELVLDRSWHTWQGILSDAVTEQRLEPSALSAGQLVLGSFHGVDQTGLFSEWHLDDVILGPAVGHAEQLRFTPIYEDDTRVAEIRYAVCEGDRPYAAMTPAERRALRWTSVPPGTSCVPHLDGLRNGWGSVLLQAIDAAGNASAVTELPFLKDTLPPEVSIAFEKTSDPEGNESKLCLAANTTGGAPLHLRSLTLRWDDTIVPVSPLGSTLTHSPTGDLLRINWPYIFRHQLNATTNGRTHRIVLTPIRDGAGNAAPDVVVTRTIDYALDHTPPTVLSCMMPSNVFFSAMLDFMRSSLAGFQPQRETRLYIARETDQPAVLRAESPSGQGGVVRRFDASPWRVATHPWLAFRLRRSIVQPQEKTRLCVTFEVQGGGEYTVPLGPSSGKGKELPLPQRIVWVSNAWTEVTVHVGELLRGALSRDALAAVRIVSLGFRFDEAPKGHQLDLQSLFIFAPWGPEDAVQLDAFDASGVAGVRCGATVVDGFDVRPAALPAGADAGTGWLALQVQDKAGNRSFPLRVPLGRIAASMGAR